MSTFYHDDTNSSPQTAMGGVGGVQLYLLDGEFEYLLGRRARIVLW